MMMTMTTMVMCWRAERKGCDSKRYVRESGLVVTRSEAEEWQRWK